MALKKKKIILKSISRQDISNPNHKIPHEELLKKAGIKKFTNYEILDLENGRIIVNPVNSEENTNLKKSKKLTFSNQPSKKK